MYRKIKTKLIVTSLSFCLLTFLMSSSHPSLSGVVHLKGSSLCKANKHFLPIHSLPPSYSFETKRLSDLNTILCSPAREPVKSSITETLQGLETIRAFKRRDHFTEGFDAHLNLLSWSRFLALCVHSRLLLICVFVIVLFISAVIYVSIMLVGSKFGP